MDNIKKFEDFLDRLQELLDNAKKQGHIIVRVEDLENAFPELAKSKNEEIRKRIIHALHGDVLDMEETARAIAWLEKQGQTFTKKDVDDAYLKGVTDTKNEIEKQYEANYQIRKDIATFIFNYRGDIKDRAKWIDYLGINVSFVNERGEQKLTDNLIQQETMDIAVAKCFNESEVDKVDPKFHEGEWIITPNNQIKQIKSISFGNYRFTDGSLYNIIDVDNKGHLWNIEDANNGDVLVASDESVFIYSGSTNTYAQFYIALSKYGGINTIGGDWEDKNYVKPATKEQRDQLERAMTNAGYRWNKEELKLEKI